VVLSVSKDNAMKKVLFVILLSAILFSFGLPAAGQTAAPGSFDDQLVTAVKNGDAAAVQQLLKQGANIEAMSGDGATPLTAAARSGNTDLVKLLLASGANIEGEDMASDTALENAADAGYLDTVTLLLAWWCVGRPRGAETFVLDLLQQMARHLGRRWGFVR
jgi:hypothetical protein